MHIPSHFRENRLPVLHQLIRQNPLATFIVSDDGDITVNHFPLLLLEDGKQSLLQGHIPRANPLWQLLDGSCKATAVFHGPQAYVTPSWYPGKQEHGRVVPTWNYVVVHTTGSPRAIEDTQWLLQHLNALTDQQESAEQDRWQVADAPDDYIARLTDGIVGIEMPIASIAGKWKVSQNRSDADRLGVAAGLRKRGDQNETLATLVEVGVNDPRQNA